MSVINQMLQDLDQRRSRAAGDTSFSTQVRAVPRRREFRRALSVAVGLALAAAAGILWWQFRPQAASPPPSVAAAAVPAPARPAASARAAGTASEAAPKPVSANQAASTMGQTPPAAVASSAAPSMQATLATPDAQVAQAAPATAAAAATARGGAPSVDPGQEAAGGPVRPGRWTKSASDPRPLADSDDDATPPTKEITAQERTDNDYARAVVLAQSGQNADAIILLGKVLQSDPANAQARQTLVGLLVDGRNFPEAERQLQTGLALDPAQTGLAVILARLQVERGDTAAALQTLNRSLPHAAGDADYLAFLAALLQRENRHKEAIGYYLQALRSQPDSGVWLMGLGISLKAENRTDDARQAFRRALAGNTLSAGLRAYVEQQLLQLK